jgi:hypothetical protein
MNFFVISALVLIAILAYVYKYGAGDYLSKLYIEYRGSKIIFVPDMEGNAVALVALLREVLYLEGIEKSVYENLIGGSLFQYWMDNIHKLRVHSGYAIICGGDTIDKHFANIHPEFAMYDLYRFWVALKENNPNMVHLIAGNRDSNKTRIVPLMRKFYAEAGERKKFAITKQFADSFNGCADKGLKDGLIEMMDKGAKITAFIFIQLILQKTMGINPSDFLLHVSKYIDRYINQRPDEEEIVQQFIANFSVGSAWYEYIKKARIYHIIGGNLFSHCVPVPYKSDGTECFDLTEVCRDLNTFYTLCVNQIGVDGADWSKWDAYWLPNKKSWATTQFQDVDFKSIEYKAWLSALKKSGIKNLVSGHLPVGATPSIECLKEFGITIFRLDMHTQMTAINIRTDMTTTENICHFKFSPNGAWACNGTVFGNNYTSSNADPNLKLYGNKVEINGENWVIRNISNGSVHLHYFLHTPPSKWETKYMWLKVNHSCFNDINIISTESSVAPRRISKSPFKRK